VEHKCLKESKKQIFLPKYALVAAGRLAGERNGKKYGMRLNTVPIDVEMAERNNSPRH
jgi:hypothetical protein